MNVKTFTCVHSAGSLVVSLLIYIVQCVSCKDILCKTINIDYKMNYIPFSEEHVIFDFQMHDASTSGFQPTRVKLVFSIR